MAETKVFELRDDGFYKVEVIDEEEFIKCSIFGEMADCAVDSLFVYFKLRKAGAKRYRGKRFHDRETGDPKAFHYWVENGGFVFERHGGVQAIYDKQTFYEQLEITDVEVAEYNCFFGNELDISKKMKDEYKTRVLGDRELEYLINVYKNKQRTS